MNIFLLGVIPSRASKAGHLFSATHTTCVLSDINSPISSVTPLWKFKFEWVLQESLDIRLTLREMEYGNAQESEHSSVTTSLKAAAENYGKPEWGNTGPTDAGDHNSWPEETNFFKRQFGGWNGEYGKFFLSWYSQMLLDHGERILTSATSIFNNRGVKISVKIAGIHWHYGTRSHAPQLTAGYYNTRFRDGYLPIAKTLGRHGAVFNFTCIGMHDYEQPQSAQCSPEKLVQQVALATRVAQVSLAGENTLPRYDDCAHEQILQAALLTINEEMCSFTYLRLNQELFHYNNWRKFVAFVKKMRYVHRSGDQVEQEAEYFINATQPLVKEAAIALMA